MIVQDTNDNEPKFEKEFYEIDVDESLPKDSQIVPLNARDLDKGKNGRLTYTIIEHDPCVEDYVGICRAAESFSSRSSWIVKRSRASG